MSDEISGSAPTRASLPDRPHLDWLRKQAKHRLAALHESDPAAKLTDAQRAVAREYGFPSWRALKAHVDSLSIDGQLFDAAREGDVETLGRLLDQHPDRLHARLAPYEWSLLHVAAHKGHLALVDLLLLRGLDPNTREKGDNTYPMHWAAAAGHLDVVRRLAEAGGDVVGDGDDHALQVIGWATCWEGARDAIHAEIADYLVRHGARHHIFSLIALDRADALRELVAAEPAVLNQRMSRNEDHATPLHFAVRMRRPGTVALLIELGADPLAVDASGYPATAYASTPDVDRAMMLRIRAMTSAELLSAERGLRSPRGSTLDLLAALTLHDWDTAERLLRENPSLADARGTHGGALHLASKRGDALAVQWLLDHGASPNGLWPHWDADVTPLHLAALGGHLEVARRLLAAGADPTIRDSKHESDAIGWAAFCGQKEVQQLLEGSLKR
jgi:ankyrin repeat protein